MFRQKATTTCFSCLNNNKFSVRLIVQNEIVENVNSVLHSKSRQRRKKDNFKLSNEITDAVSKGKEGRSTL